MKQAISACRPKPSSPTSCWPHAVACPGAKGFNHKEQAAIAATAGMLGVKLEEEDDDRTACFEVRLPSGPACLPACLLACRPACSLEVQHDVHAGPGEACC